MLDYLVNLVSRLGHWSYLAISIGAALESAAFLGLFVPGESLVLVTGFLASQGVLDLDVSIWAVALGAVVGDSIGYEMGRRLGRPALLRYGSNFGLNHERIERADAFFRTHGGKSIFLGHFVGFARAVVPFLAGASLMKYTVFLSYSVIGATLWSSVTVSLGYFLGASWQTAEHWIGRASAIFGGIFLFALLLLWLYRLAMRYEKEIRLSFEHFIQEPRAVRFRRRFAPQIAFFGARLSPSGYLGLNLTVGALVLIGASWLFGGIAEDVLTGDPLTVVDVQVANWLHARATPIVTKIMLVISHVNGPLWISIYVALAVVCLALKRDWYWAICTLVTVPTGTLLNVLMKYAFHRDRPSFDHPLLSLTTYSFPSGHAAGSTLFYGLFAAYLVTKADRWRSRVVIALCAFAVVILVSLSRMYLGVHYLSDVLAGMAEGVAWLSLCLAGMDSYWQHRIASRGSTKL